ncbi:OTU domain-containing protein 3 [Frankliniella fusca]|uniref:OTU domain-containing protein 3 n=1 Tax=Frankliniella fusca TaxID=407009 RepID=A0AAE1H651_9NEOP|nr:OTU domain-containing protein 3 [Frankliniella fusca]
MAAAQSWVDVDVGLVLSEHNNGQGDCLFVAISQQLDGQMTSIQLRQMAVQFLTQHTEDCLEELLSLGWDMIENNEIPMQLEGDLLIDAVLQTLGNPHTWGGAECIAAISLALNKEIRVYQENGPTFVFPGERNPAPALRIVLKYPRGANERRTLYESVLNWRAEPPPRSLNVETRDAESQTNASSTAEVQNPQQAGNCPNRRRSDSAMVLRPRQQGLTSENTFRDGNFSDAEEFDANNADSTTSEKKIKMQNVQTQ